MADNVLSVLTYKSVDTVLESGGTQSWMLDRARAMRCKYAVLCRNARHPSTEGTEAHGSAFMVGRIRDVVPSTETEGRWLVLFSEYALCEVADQWSGRNPVRFWTTADYDKKYIDFDMLPFQPMPTPMQTEPSKTALGLTIAEAKAGLALAFGVDPSAVEITIRG